MHSQSSILTVIDRALDLSVLSFIVFAVATLIPVIAALFRRSTGSVADDIGSQDFTPPLEPLAKLVEALSKARLELIAILASLAFLLIAAAHAPKPDPAAVSNAAAPRSDKLQSSVPPDSKLQEPQEPKAPRPAPPDAKPAPPETKSL